MIITEGGRRAAIRTDEASAAYDSAYATRCERPASAETGRAIRAVVELSRAFGGMTMRALLGAQFMPDPQSLVTAFEVPFGEPLGFGLVADCGSELGRPLVAGLPRDFADATLAGLAGDAQADPLPAGLLRVDRAGFDETGSSEAAFKLAGDLLRHVLHALLHDEEPLAVAQTVVSAW
ncbi:hypothetical protein [Candidatus Protofrankia californiensis]|uniref:hypothetical protein n=1 Tax=Candidatus Protofrankia californiensis TaxID=1839754 RepID=UPI001041A6E2|nr:hypothetical protein [Candidatus Protofrankia californiensis]